MIFHGMHSTSLPDFSKGFKNIYLCALFKLCISLTSGILTFCLGYFFPKILALLIVLSLVIAGYLVLLESCKNERSED